MKFSNNVTDIASFRHNNQVPRINVLVGIWISSAISLNNFAKFITVILEGLKSVMKAFLELAELAFGGSHVPLFVSYNNDVS